MSYLNYPPGSRIRRLVYSEGIRRQSINYETTVLPTFFQEYQEKKYLISKKLFKKSKISLNKSFGYCSICISNILPFEVIRTLSCKHYYHVDCIDYWFTDNNTCPECRNKIQ